MRVSLAALLLGTAMLAGHGVQAAPLVPHTLSVSRDVMTVKDGCGVGFHRLSNGICRPQPEGPRLMRLFARKCPLGYRRNPLGKCVKE